MLELNIFKILFKIYILDIALNWYLFFEMWYKISTTMLKRYTSTFIILFKTGEKTFLYLLKISVSIFTWNVTLFDHFVFMFSVE